MYNLKLTPENPKSKEFYFDSNDNVLFIQSDVEIGFCFHISVSSGGVTTPFEIYDKNYKINRSKCDRYTFWYEPHKCENRIVSIKVLIS